MGTPIITTAGLSKIAAVQGASGTLVVDRFMLANIAGLVDTDPVNPLEPTPIVGDQVFVGAPTGNGYVNPDSVVYSLHLDTSVGDFNFNWMGLLADDDTLMAVQYVPVTTKTATVGPVPGNNLTRNFLMQYTGAQATAAIVVQASTWQLDFNTRLALIDEHERQSNEDIYGRQAFYQSGFLVVNNAGTYELSVGQGYVAGVRINQAILSTFDPGVLPKDIWLDVSLQGDINGVESVFAVVADNAAQADYIDGNGIPHYLEKIASIDAGGAVSDLRTVIAPVSFKGYVIEQAAINADNFLINGDRALRQRVGLVSNYDLDRFFISDASAVSDWIRLSVADSIITGMDFAQEITCPTGVGEYYEQRVERPQSFLGLQTDYQFYIKAASAITLTLEEVWRINGVETVTSRGTLAVGTGFQLLDKPILMRDDMSGFAGVTGDFLSVRISGFGNTKITVTGEQWSRGNSPRDYTNQHVFNYLPERYYEKTYDINVAPGSSNVNGQRAFSEPGTTAELFNVGAFVARKRTTPTVIFYARNGTINTIHDVLANVNRAVISSLVSATGITSVTAAQAFTVVGGRAEAILLWTADAEIR